MPGRIVRSATHIIRIFLGRLDAALASYYGSLVPAIGVQAPVDEVERLRSLHMHDLLDTKREREFDLITRLASAVFEVPISLVSLVDRDRQWFKSRVGLDAQETGRDASFCAHAILTVGGPFVVEDASKDERFMDNPLVTGKPWIRFYAGQPVRGIDGQPLGTLCIISPEPRHLSTKDRDILVILGELTETLIKNRHVEGRLAQVREQRTLQLRAIAHDLASPLSALKIRLAALGHADEGKARTLAQAMTSTVASLERMMRHLSMGIHGSGMAEELDIAPVRLLDIVDDVVAGNTQAAKAKGVAIEVEGSDDAVVMADGASTRRILHNLISNAIRHAHASVKIGWTTSHSAVACFVHDDGQGFTKEMGDRLFEPYVQARKDAGFETFGLGLYICRTLVEAQGGTISATSPGPGKGATFSFTLRRPRGVTREGPTLDELR